VAQRVRALVNRAAALFSRHGSAAIQPVILAKPRSSRRSAFAPPPCAPPAAVGLLICCGRRAEKSGRARDVPRQIAK